MILLWFDVEKRYKTIHLANVSQLHQLWFDVEKRYKTIVLHTSRNAASCGLMQKRDIRQ